jgi:cysteine desulfurase
MTKKIDRGYEVSFLPVNQYAQVQEDAFKNAIKQNTILASFMWGNNEIGSLNDIESLCAIAKREKILFHSDATQVLGKIDIDVKKIPIDFLSVSAHKIYGPKGVGAAFIRQSGLSDFKLTSLIHGGLQERGYRAGTSAVHNIVGFGKACEIAKRDMNEYIKKISQLEIEAKKMLTVKYPGVEFLGNPNHHIPGVIGVMIPGIVNDMFINSLADKIAISSGSACGIGEPSYVIKEINLEHKSSSFIRLSLSKFSSIQDMLI